MPELINTLQAMHKKEHETRKFQAGLKGINLEGEEEENKKGETSFDDIRLKAAGISAASNDVVSLQGQFAAEAGFGIGAGLGYSRSN